MRIRGAKTELEEAGESTEGMAESTATLRKEMLALSGVDIMLDKNTFKSTYQIMDELSQKWENLTDIQRATITELMAGKHQGNIMSSLMSNFDTARKALETSLNSSGSALAEHAKWSESLEARLNRLKAAWQSLSQTFMNSSFLKVGIDLIVSFVDTIDKLIDSLGTLGTLGIGVGIWKTTSALLSASKDVGSLKTLANVLPILTKAFPKASEGVGIFTSALAGSSEMTGLAKAATIGKGAISGLWTVIAAHPIIATVAAVAAGIAIFDKLTESADELADRIEGITSEYRDQHDSLMKLKGDFDTSSEDSLISKYGELSKGVNELGENISLTADEYEEYQGIVGTIASQFPSLVTGYNSQGDAILDCAGNVDKLVESYRNLIKEQNSEVLKNGTDIFKDFNNDIRNTLPASLRNTDAKPLAHLGKLNELLSLNGNDLDAYIENNLNAMDARLISEMLDKNGIKRDVMFGDGLTDISYESYEQHVKRAIKEEISNVKSILDKASVDLNAYAEDLGTVTEAYFSTAFLGGNGSDIGNFSRMSDRMQNVITQIASGFDSEFYAQFLDGEDGFERLKEYYNSMLVELNTLRLSDDGEKFEAAFDLKTKFNGGEISYGDYVNGIKDVEELINDLDLAPEVKDGIKLTLNTDEVIKNYDALHKRLTSDEYNIKMNPDEAEEFLNNLTASEYSVAVGLMLDDEIDLSKFDIDSLRDYIEKEAALQDALNYTIAIDVETESIGALNTALAESVSATGLSSESITALKGRYAELESEGYNLSAMFEETSNGIHLNKEAVSELEQALASNKLTEADKQLEVLKGRYDELAKEIDNCTDAGDRAALYTEQQSIIDKINDLATLASQYKGLTSAYNAWQNAESAGSERDMYEGIIEGFETVKDEISRGWLDDGTIEFLKLIKGEKATIIDGEGNAKEIDIATASAKELKQVWKDLDDTIENTSYSVKDFFTVDEDGNSTSKGVYNFLDALQELESSDTVSSVLKKQFKDIDGIEDLVEIKDGNIVGFNFEVVGGDKAVADALGISEELVQIMLRAADDAGFVVNLEGAYTQLADLKTEAESARDTLIDLQKNGLEKLKGVDVNFDLNAKGNDLVAEQKKAVELLNKFKKDGKIDLKMEGAQQALDIAEYLTIKLDDLTEPKIMQIDVSEVEENLREPIEKMQEIVELSKQKNLISLTGDTEELKKTQDEIIKIADELAKLDDSTKKSIGIDFDWDAETIASKIEKGEIEIPAELKLDVQMSDDLKDMRLMMMNQLGLASDNEVKLKVGYDIDDSVVDSLTDEEKEVVVKYLAEHDEVDDYTPEQKEALVKYIADGGNLDSYTPEEKQAIVQYFADGGNVDSYTPEEKQAIVEYLTDSGDPDSWTPEQKEAVAKFKKDSAEVDNYTPEDKEAIAKFIKDSSEPDNYQPEPKQQKVISELDSSDVDNHKFKDRVFTVKAVLQKVGDWTNKLLGGGSTRKIVNGTANVDGTAFIGGTTGTAFKHGNWGTKDSGTALVGELGTETLVRDGRYYTIGDTGAEFIHYEKGDIVFNHKQTEELFRYGKVTSGGGRGKALASGTAFSYGSSGYGGGIMPEEDEEKEKTSSTKNTSSSKSSTKSSSTNKSSSSSSSSSSKSSSSKSSSSSTTSSSEKEDKFEENIDWIEIAISRIERAIDKLSQKANNIYKSWSSRNKALTEEIEKVREEIELQDDAANRYLKEANSVGLSDSWASKVRNGEVDLSTITDEGLAEKIKQYQDYYEKYLACIDASEELKEKEAELYAQRFENIQSQYDGILQGYEHTETMLNEYISQAEAQGHIVSKEYYDALIANEKSNIEELKKEQAELIAERDNAVAEGKITKGSEAWIEQCAAIDTVTQAIEEANTALLEYSNSIRDIDWEIFDLIQERISDITSETEFLIELMSNEKLFDDKGNLTGQGVSTMALHALNYNTAMYQSDEYGEEIAKIDKQIAEDPYDQELINRRRELIELQRESILEAENQKNAIRDLVEEGINLELDALQERIDLHNEELDSMKNLYDYQKNVEEQTKNISSLRKQISAYEGFDDEETRAKVQELKVSLEEAETDLQETEYDKFISDQASLLDTLYTEYETILNTRLDNVDYLLQQVIDGVNAFSSLSEEQSANLLASLGAEGTLASALGVDGAIASAIVNAMGENGSIKSILNKEVTDVGTKLSTAMNNIWSVGDGNAKSILTMYGEGFQSKQTTTNTTLNSIKIGVDKMVAASDKEAQNKTSANKTSTSAEKDPTKNNSESNKSTNTSNNTTTNKSSGDGKPKVGDKVKFVSGKYYYDSQGKKPIGSKYQGKEVYITNINTESWATHPYHISTGKKLGNGDLGWLKLDQIKGYATGKHNFSNNETAWTQEGKKKEFIIRPSDGAILTPIAKGDSVLSASATNNLWNMANSPAEFIRDNLNLGIANVPNSSNISNVYSQTIENVTLSMPNVRNYNEMLSQMQKDRNFEKLITSMTIDRIAGKSSLAKNKSIR